MSRLLSSAMEPLILLLVSMLSSLKFVLLCILAANPSSGCDSGGALRLLDRFSAPAPYAVRVKPTPPVWKFFMNDFRQGTVAEMRA